MQIPVFTRAPRFLRCLNPLALRRANSWSTLSCLRGGRHPKARKVCENALFWYLLLLAGAVSSFGRAPHLQCGGDRFESGTVHNIPMKSGKLYLYIIVKEIWHPKTP